jgi:hypothetical protein
MRTLPVRDRAPFLRVLADRAGTTYHHVRNVSAGRKACSCAVAMQAEILSNGALTRQQLRQDAALVWVNQTVHSPIVTTEVHAPPPHTGAIAVTKCPPALRADSAVSESEARVHAG